MKFCGGCGREKMGLLARKKTPQLPRQVRGGGSADGWDRVRGMFGLWRRMGREGVANGALVIKTREVGKGFKVFWGRARIVRISGFSSRRLLSACFGGGY
jgi:hypothetical protein